MAQIVLVYPITGLDVRGLSVWLPLEAGPGRGHVMRRHLRDDRRADSPRTWSRAFGSRRRGQSAHRHRLLPRGVYLGQTTLTYTGNLAHYRPGLGGSPAMSSRRPLITVWAWRPGPQWTRGSSKIGHCVGRSMPPATIPFRCSAAA